MPDSGKKIDVLMPSMGEGVVEATLIKWLKQVGDSVQKNEPLLEVSTDKVDTEIPAPDAGVLTELVAGEGDVIQVGQVLARIGGSLYHTPAIKEKNFISSETKTSESDKAYSKNLTEVFSNKSELLRKTSPLVRKMAKEGGISSSVLQEMSGTGLNGKITKLDFLKFIQTGHLPPNTPSNTYGNGETLDGVPVRREKMSKMRRLIAEHMVASVKTSPHVTTVFEIDMHSVAQFREKNKKEFEQNQGIKLTFTAFLIYVAVQVIKEFPLMNVSVDGDEILFKESINVGCAVALETGLIVPVIKNAEKLDLSQIAQKLDDLASRARSKKLLPNEVQGGTFSITNPGGWGSILSNPIINQPQVAILSIGNIVKRPVVIDDMIAIRPMMFAGLTFDHRVIDGEGGSKFLARYKNLLENFNGRSQQSS